MTKEKFLQQLRRSLKKLPPDEISQAMEYYSEYLEDAEDLEACLRELGNPRDIAAQIRASSAVKRMEEKPGVKSGLNAAVVAVIAVFASPVAIPVALLLGIAAMVLLAAVLVVFLLLFLAVLLTGILGFSTAAIGFSVLFQDPFTALFFIGSGFFRIGLSLLMGTGFFSLIRLICSGMARIMNRKLKRSAL